MYLRKLILEWAVVVCHELSARYELIMLLSSYNEVISFEDHI